MIPLLTPAPSGRRRGDNKWIMNEIEISWGQYHLESEIGQYIFRNFTSALSDWSADGHEEVGGAGMVGNNGAVHVSPSTAYCHFVAT